MERVEAKLLVDCRCELGEGVQWNAPLRRLFWTDIHGKRLLSCNEGGDELRTIDLPERLTAFAFDRRQRVLAAFESGLFACDDIESLPTRRRRLTQFEANNPTSRYNDGRCDRAGRFIVGGMDENQLKPTSSLTCFDGGDVRTLVDGVGCSNALCFSPDGHTMYFADTAVGDLWYFDYDPGSAKLGPRHVFARGVDHPGVPDGACVDSTGTVWNARFNGSCVLAFDARGRAFQRVELPVPQVTCACFGGDSLNRLYITTGRENLTPVEADQFPLSGSVFVAETDAIGLPESICLDLA